MPELQSLSHDIFEFCECAQDVMRRLGLKGQYKEKVSHASPFTILVTLSPELWEEAPESRILTFSLPNPSHMFLPLILIILK